MSDVSGSDGINIRTRYRDGKEHLGVAPKPRENYYSSSSSSCSPKLGHKHRDSSKPGARLKPSRELYRPPANNQLNPSAKEFAPLQSSKSFDFSNKEKVGAYPGSQQDNIVLNRTGLTITFAGGNKQQGYGLAKSRSISSQMTFHQSPLSPTEYSDSRQFSMQSAGSGGINQDTLRPFSFVGPAENSGIRLRSQNYNHHRESRQSMYLSGGLDHRLGSSASGSELRHPAAVGTSGGGSSDMMAMNDWRLQIDIAAFAFPQEIINTISKAMEDPNRVPGRSLMELVKQIINRVIIGTGRANQSMQKEAPSLPEQAAMLCTGIIQHEDRKTFQESLINTCQEIYHERERLLRQDISRWNSYISFLNHMYGKLKRRQLLDVERGDGVAPRFVLLSLLAECCTCTLTSNLQSLAEVEAVFGVLTMIGRDLEAEMPGRMTLLVTCLREAFLNYRLSHKVSKLLLQLIELEAAGWTLPAQAVMYYYPGAK
jgi:hypothetical protein